MIFEAASRAVDDAGISHRDIDSVVLASQDVLDGRGISNMSNAGPAGGYMKDEIRVADDGIYALILAALQIGAGRSELALVISWSMASETTPHLVSAAEFDPFYLRPLGLSEVSALALQATASLLQNEDARRAATEVVVRDDASGQRIGAAEVYDSPIVSWPVRRADLCEAADGACALVLASGEVVMRLSNHPAWVRGVGWASEVYGLGNRDLTRSDSARAAADDAYARAGISSASQLDVIEITSKSPFQEAVLIEALGIARAGCGSRYILETAATPDRRPCINPSGGVRSAYLSASAGLDQAIAAVQQITGRAGDRQVPNVEWALAHGSSGQCMQSNGVVVLGADPYA